MEVSSSIFTLNKLDIFSVIVSTLDILNMHRRNFEHQVYFNFRYLWNIVYALEKQDAGSDISVSSSHGHVGLENINSYTFNGRI